MLRRPVVPNGYRARPPADPDLVLGDHRLGQEIAHEVVGFEREILADPDAVVALEVYEVRGEPLVDEQDLFVGVGIRADDRMLDRRVLELGLLPRDPLRLASNNARRTTLLPGPLVRSNARLWSALPGLAR